MPKMLTSDNLSTWLSTRYATRNKNNRTESGSYDKNRARQERKKSSSERANTTTESEGYLEWLSPKRAKMAASNINKKFPPLENTQITPNEKGNKY